MVFLPGNTEHFNPDYPGHHFTHNYTGERVTLTLLERSRVDPPTASGGVWRSFSQTYFSIFSGLTMSSRWDSENAYHRLIHYVQKLHLSDEKQYDLSRIVIIEDESSMHENDETIWASMRQQAVDCVKKIRQEEAEMANRTAFMIINVGYLNEFYECKPRLSDDDPETECFQRESGRFHFLQNCVEIDTKLTTIRDILRSES